MNKLKKYLALSLVSVGMLAASCEKIEDFGDTNVDPTKVAVPSTRSLLTNAMQNSTALFVGSTQGTVIAQHFSEGPYLTSSGYADATGGQAYSAWYTSPLIQLKKIIDYNTAGTVEADQGANGSKNNQLAVARIMKAYIFWKLTDRWGDIPYSEALQGGDNITPKYDKQEDIYKDIFKELKEAAAQIDAGLGAQGDIILGGNMSRWKKFAATQRMLMALRMSKVYPAAGGLAATEFNAAMADVIASNAENIQYKFISGDPNNYNPWHTNYTISNRNDFAISLTMVNYMKANGTGTDPRLPVYAEVLPGNQIKGLTYGNKVQTNIPNAYSRLGNSLRLPGTPANILTFAQVQFAKAEAAKLGWIPGGDVAAKGFYDSGIDASLAQNGVADATFKDASGIAYAPATAIEQIATQRWIHLYLDGWEAWSEWRRTGFPVLAAGANSANPAGIPRRQMYPAADKTVNAKQYEVVLTQQGPNTLNTRMWWDK
ncbi:SusD/RagB family nutrient-binding outer membrane lipoprotein [Flavihumibacter sp. R14]|nr:SusD/RagB family nutrient-binding outer membrane lipoprotein [Flavihumibacter soli]